MRRIVFIGNCQMLALHDIYWRHVGAEAGDLLTYVPAYEAITEEHGQLIACADVIVEHVFDMPPTADTAKVPAAAVRQFVPVVSAGFLWPFAGEAHPHNPVGPELGGGPYPGELGDAFLNRALLRGEDVSEVVPRYLALDIARVGRLDRRYELFLDRQQQRDNICGYAIAGLIAEHFRTEQVFLSPHHPNLRVTLALAEQFLVKMGASA